MQRLVKILDAVQTAAGHAATVLTLLLTATVLYNVVMRYVFSVGSIAMQELEWYFFSAAFLLGAGFVLKEDGHVRIDILYARMSPRRRALVDLVGSALFLLPFSALMVYHSWSFAESSFSIGERSSDPGGLPFTFLIKAVIPLAFVVLFLAGTAMALRCALALHSGNGGAPDTHTPEL